MTPSSTPLTRLADAGVSIWLDDLSRERLRTGNLAELVADRAVVGVTTNPTIFAERPRRRATPTTQQLAELAAARRRRRRRRLHASRPTTCAHAADVLRPVYDATDGVDGRVSIEVDPRLAHDTDGTIAAASRLWATVDRPNVFIKIPATVEGLPAITAVLAEGISVNVTLIFSLDRYRAVMDAFLSGPRAGPGARARPGADRVGRLVLRVPRRHRDRPAARRDRHARGRGAARQGRDRERPPRVRGVYEEVVADDRWAALAAAGAHPQRPLWASTGVKDPAYPDTLYVDELVVAGVVNTMPEATLDAVADHGGDRAATRSRGTREESRGRSSTGLARLGHRHRRGHRSSSRSRASTKFDDELGRAARRPSTDGLAGAAEQNASRGRQVSPSKVAAEQQPAARPPRPAAAADRRARAGWSSSASPATSPARS